MAHISWRMLIFSYTKTLKYHEWARFQDKLLTSAKLSFDIFWVIRIFSKSSLKSGQFIKYPGAYKIDLNGSCNTQSDLKFNKYCKTAAINVMLHVFYNNSF